MQRVRREAVPAPRVGSAESLPNFRVELTSRADGVVPAFVRAHDALHQVVPDHVHIIEVNETDAFDTLAERPSPESVHSAFREEDRFA